MKINSEFPKKRVFISQPMSGVPEKTVLEIRNAIKDAVKEYYKDEPIEFVSAYENTIEEKKFTHDYSENICYLSKAINMMKDVDAVAFSPDIFSSRGCSVEYSTALAYGIEILCCERIFGKSDMEIKYKISKYKYRIEYKPDGPNPFIDDGK